MLGRSGAAVGSAGAMGSGRPQAAAGMSWESSREKWVVWLGQRSGGRPDCFHPVGPRGSGHSPPSGSFWANVSDSCGPRSSGRGRPLFAHLSCSGWKEPLWFVQEEGSAHPPLGSPSLFIPPCSHQAFIILTTERFS